VKIINILYSYLLTMVEIKIKKWDSSLLQVRCKNQEMATIALSKFGNLVRRVDWIKWEVILFFNIND